MGRPNKPSGFSDKLIENYGSADYFMGFETDNDGNLNRKYPLEKVADYTLKHREMTIGNETKTVGGFITSANNRINQAENTVAALSSSVSSQSTQLANLNSKVRSNEGNIGELQIDLANNVAALTQMNNKINAIESGPLVAETASQMTNTSKVYVYVGNEENYTNGDWYYYNGRLWVSGGAYNAQGLNLDTTLTVEGLAPDSKAVGDAISAASEEISEEISDLNGAINQAISVTEGKNLFNKSALSINKYLNVDGTIEDYNGRYVTDYIPVKTGKIVTSSFYDQTAHDQTQYGYSSICCYDVNKNVVAGGDINKQTFTVPANVSYVRITYAQSMYSYDGMVELTDDGVFTAYEPYIGKVIALDPAVKVAVSQVTGLETRLGELETAGESASSAITNLLDANITFTENGFIRYDGAFVPNDAYIATDYVDVLVGGTFVEYEYRLQMFANTKIAYYNSEKVFISAISPTDSSSLVYVEGRVPYVNGAKYVRFCTYSDAVNYYVRYASVKNAVVGAATVSNPCDYDGTEIAVFNKILCIGDSLTSGTFNYRVGDSTSNYVEYEKYSFPTYLKKLTGCDVTNMGNGGMSSAEWFAARQNDNLSGYDCVIVQLGVNDCIRYATWGSTSETSFTNIINKLKTENKNVKIFVANIIPATSYSSAQYLAFSADLLAWVQSAYASDNNVIPLDMQRYGHTKDSPAYNCGHLSALGYRRLAQDYKGYIGWYMNQNKAVFKEVQFVGTDYYYDQI